VAIATRKRHNAGEAHFSPQPSGREDFFAAGLRCE
jgi:hypothetical protein